MLNEIQKTEQITKQTKVITTSTSTTTTTTTTTETTTTTTTTATTTTKLFKVSKQTKTSKTYLTEIGAIESSKLAANITISTPSHKNFTSNQLSIITLSALLGCIYGCAFILASIWVSWLWIKRRKRKGTSTFKSSRIEPDFSTMDSDNCIHRA